MADRFKSHPTGLDTPIDDMVAISTGVDFERGPSRCIWANTAGTVSLIMKSGRAVANVALVAGPNPIRASRVTANGSSIVLFACY